MVSGGRTPVPLQTLARMAASIRHRGPDGYGFYSGPGVGLAHVRLSIIDVAGGAQPMTNERGNVLVVFNGEIYNHGQLRLELEAKGHRFRTRCDTEVLVHGFEEWGDSLPGKLDGQFAFALYDRDDHSLRLVRDRFGIRPLFYSQSRHDLYFGSEVKALQASGHVQLAPDPLGLDEVFTFWAARAPRTPFLGVSAVEPGTILHWQGERITSARYYGIDFPAAGAEPPDALPILDRLLRCSVGQRLLADVTVGGYLSGGLDSSIACALATELGGPGLNSFSVSFQEAEFDESAHQEAAAKALAVRHNVQRIGPDDIAGCFPDVVYHAETPLVRSAPAPLMLLARLTRQNGIKVVLTGEGADELFLGYELFKETAIRRFCMRQPGSRRRVALFERLYPYLGGARRGGDWWGRTFLRATDPLDPLFSHMPRFLLTSKIKDFYSGDMVREVSPHDPLTRLRDSLPAAFSRWDPLQKAAYLEMVTLLEPYLLSSQGDRMSMASGVEGRYPFLDHRLFEFAASLPSRSKLKVLEEKEILRRWARSALPAVRSDRTKQPYLAPVQSAFFGGAPQAYVEDAVSSGTTRRVGIFDHRFVAALAGRCRSGKATSMAEGQALLAVISTHLWYEQFISSPQHHLALPVSGADVIIQDTGQIPANPQTVMIQ